MWLCRLLRRFFAGAALFIRIMELQKDIRQFIELLLSHKVEWTPPGPGGTVRLDYR
jgi:hypothetical protein